MLRRRRRVEDSSSHGSSRPAPNVALAGAGMISMIHAIAAEVAGLPIVAVASRTEARAAERAEQIGCSTVGYADLPAGAEVVVVATPPALHAEQTIAALANGASVLVEKPLATTLAEADAIVEAAAAAAGQVIYAENQAFAPVVSQALELIADLGPLDYVEVRALSPRPTWGDFLDPAWGGGCLFDLGAHPIALTLLMAGDDPAVSVTARLERSPDLEVDDLAAVELQFASGLHAHLEVSWREPSTTWDLQASSATGVVRAELLPTVALERDGEPVSMTRAPSEVDQFVHDLGYIEQLCEVRRVVTDRASSTSTPIDASFGRRVLEITCAAYASASTGGDLHPLPFRGDRTLTPHQLWTTAGD